MNFHVYFVLLCVLVVMKQCLTVKECVQRRLGACKILTPGDHIDDNEFNSLPPDGFVLKTSIEINLEKNKHSFENNVLIEKKRQVKYTLDNEALVEILIKINKNHTIEIFLGGKYRVAQLHYFFEDYFDVQYSRYTPILPTFPYTLHLEITTNGTFSILADGNTEPFFEYQIKGTGPFHVHRIYFSTAGNNDDLIAFVDCSMKYKPNCGVRRVDELYGCREWLKNSTKNLQYNAFQKAYGKDVLFDEFIVLDTESDWARIYFTLGWSILFIDFRVNSTEATLTTGELKKSVRTEQWFQVPASPYAVRVSIRTDGEHDYVLRIVDVQATEILSLKLCGISAEFGNLERIELFGARLYFGCFTFNNSADTIMNERPRKIKETEDHYNQYHKDCYNYTKEYLYIWDFVVEPVMYEYEFGKSTKDWCPDEPQPDVLVTWKYADDSLQGIIERLNATLHSDLQKLNAQNNATAETNAALLTELKKVSGDTNVVLNELKVISDTLTTHLRQNATTVNNSYSSNNQLTVTDFLKQN